MQTKRARAETGLRFQNSAGTQDRCGPEFSDRQFGRNPGEPGKGKERKGSWSPVGSLTLTLEKGLAGHGGEEDNKTPERRRCRTLLCPFPAGRCPCGNSKPSLPKEGLVAAGVGWVGEAKTAREMEPCGLADSCWWLSKS